MRRGDPNTIHRRSESEVVQRDTRSLALHLGCAAAVVSVPILLGAALEVAFSGLSTGTGSLPAWLPTVGTVGQTVAAYTLAVSVLTYLVVPAAVFALGYRYGRERSPPA